MNRESYYELRCDAVEMFYGNLLEENYTPGQTAARCLDEFRQELAGGDRTALILLSTILSLLARQDSRALGDFAAEIDSLRHLSLQPGLWEGLGREEQERMREDVDFTLETAAVD